MRIISLVLISVMLYACGDSFFNNLPTNEQIEQKIAKGDFAEAKKMIRFALTNDSLTPQQRYDLSFKIDRLDRIEQDFSELDTSVFAYIKKFHPNVTKDEIAAWEKSNALENMTINGTKRYFYAAGRNLFRIDTTSRKYFESANGRQSDSLDRLLVKYIPSVLATKKGDSHLLAPIKMKIKYTISVKPGEVPSGEVIRVWMPYPRTDVVSQTDIKLISTSQPQYIIASDSVIHKSIYMEGVALDGKPTVFSYELSYTSYNKYFAFKPEDIAPYDTNSKIYQEYTAESAPQIVFSENIKAAVKDVVGDETNPYLKVKKIFEWININFPWASAREYSTIPNIPEYVLANRHGDCGQVSLLFITMARCAGVPAKWQSGWMMHPGNKNLHDWAEVYYDGIGWVPVDQSFGRIMDAPDSDSYYFFTKGLDAYRMVVNKGISGDFYPAKIYPRSETIDFQRGEVEWKGENLYFGRWRYKMDIEYIK